VDQIHEVSLEPLSSLRSALGRIGAGAHGIKTWSTRFGRAVRLPWRFDPVVGVDPRRRIDARAFAQARAVDLETTGKAGVFIRLARFFRSSAQQTFARSLTPESAAVMDGLLLGDKKKVSAGLMTAFQDSGALHLLIAAGLKEGFVVGIVYFLCSRFGLKRKYSGMAAIAVSWFYVIAAGFDPPFAEPSWFNAASGPFSSAPVANTPGCCGSSSLSNCVTRDPLR